MKDITTTYCHTAIQSGEPNSSYHNLEYGFPVIDDDELFGRLILEINQAGLSWTTILKKREGLYDAYSQFNINKVAHYTNQDQLRLLANPAIVRNKLKVNAIIHNAQVILKLQKEFGSFKSWLDAHHPMSKQAWVKLFKKTFKFTGGEITNEFLMSIGYLEGAHHPQCPIYNDILKMKPKWSEKSIPKGSEKVD